MTAAETAPGRFGPYGGRYVAETLVPALEDLDAAWASARSDAAFMERLDGLLSDYVGRPTPLYRATGLEAALEQRLGPASGAGRRVLLKREDLCHTGAHKLNNCLGQALLARRMGKTRVIAETGAGQHGVATATAAALLGLRCDVYMGTTDVVRQAPNVDRMRLLGATVIPVPAGAGTLKDAMNEALRDWVASVDDTHYVVGSTAGPHPFPSLVRDLQSVIGREARAQALAKVGRLPDAALACVGGGSNAMGLFSAFLDDAAVRLFGVEAGGSGLASGLHAAPLTAGTPGVLHGARTYLLQDDDGQVTPAHSIAAGLDYPGVGPQLSHLRDTGRLEVRAVGDEEALDACRTLCRREGILPALESSHALAALPAIAEELGGACVIVVSLSGRGDKDMPTLLPRLVERT